MSNKLDPNIIEKIKECFPQAFINNLNEIIVHKRDNIYFRLEDCSNEEDIKVKIIHWCSRACFKGVSLETQLYMQQGVNEFLGTEFNEDDFDLIYTHLGNGVDEEKTRAFIQSGYKASVLDAKIQDKKRKNLKAKRNKLYFVQNRDDPDCGCIIVSARTSKEAKKFSGDIPFDSWIDIKVNAIKCGQTFYDEGSDRLYYFDIVGVGFVYTDKKTGSIEWMEFIAELEKQERIEWEKTEED